NRVMMLWAGARLPAVLPAEKRQAIVDAAFAAQQQDGGWSLSSLGPFKRSDESAPDGASDGYATGLVVYALEQAGVSRADPRVRRGLDWLVQHQDAATGMWRTASLNKSRDPATDIGKFMSDAASAYAVLALTNAR